MAPPYSHRVSRVRRYSGYRWLFRLFVYRTLTFFGWTSHSIPLNLYNAVFCPNPESITTLGLASSAFARHYLRNHFCFLLLWVLRCFSSPRSPSLRNDWPSTSRVAPFGNLGIKGYLHLPQAYRSLSRPSSPPRAKASTVCPCLLSLSLTLLPFIAKIEARVGLIYLQLALFFCYFTFLKLSNTSKIFFYPLRSLSWRITDSNR